MREVVIVSGSRTAIGNFGGSLKNVPVVRLGAAVIRDVLERVGLRPISDSKIDLVIPDHLKNKRMAELEHKSSEWDDSLTPVVVDEVIMGNVLQAGQGQNPARQALIHAGLAIETPALAINKVCGSALRAIALGATSIRAGQNDIVIAGGQENMSRVPLALPNARWGYKMELTGKGEICDLMVFDGLYEIFYGYHMGVTAENIASIYGISRKEQDELSVLSHARAMAAIRAGLFKEEIVPLKLDNGRGKTVVFDTDERPRDTSMEQMARLKPAFKEGGTVTAGNSSGVNDAASAVLLMSADKAKELGLEPIVKIKTFASVGVEPALMGLGPVPAVMKVLKDAKMTLDDIDMIELNEAFAAQAIACMRQLGIENDRPNELGSGISLGHPIGCTGSRQVVTGMNQMKRKGYHTGLFTLCVGGGMGMAMIVER